jgi:hypothetical protein
VLQKPPLRQAAKRCATFMKNTLTIILILIRFLTFGQENKLAEIDNEVNSIDKDSILTIKEFNLENQTLKVWLNDKNQILKIVENRNVNYGEIKSTIYLRGTKPIKTIESENVYFWLPDSLAKIKGYSIDLKEEYTATSYILNWNKKERKLIITGKLTGESNISFELKKYEGIIRRSKNLISE